MPVVGAEEGPHRKRRKTPALRAAIAGAALVTFASLQGSAVALAGTAERPVRGPREAAAARALEYLRTTRDEIGIDVLVAVQVYGELTGDPRAADVVAAQRGRIPPEEMARYGHLLEIPKPAFPSAPLASLAPSRRASDGEPSDDDRTRSCLLEIQSCGWSESCRAFPAADASRSVLTHQAMWLLFERWRGCDLALDAELLRRKYASRLLAESRSDSRPSDLAFERLAMLGHLGFASAIEKGWIDALLASQQAKGCFPSEVSAPCHPHPTALALWVLGLATLDSGRPR